MKVNFTPLHSRMLAAGKGVLVLLVALFFSLPAFSQAPTPADEIGDLSSIKWKVTPELNTLIAVEQTKISVALSAPTVAEDEKALYKAYDRMLTYLQSDIQANKPVDEAILASYEKVLTDAISDPELKSMPEGHLITFVPGLIETLTEAPTPTASN